MKNCRASSSRNLRVALNGHVAVAIGGAGMAGHDRAQCGRRSLGGANGAPILEARSHQLGMQPCRPSQVAHLTKRLYKELSDLIMNPRPLAGKGAAIKPAAARSELRALPADHPRNGQSINRSLQPGGQNDTSQQIHVRIAQHSRPMRRNVENRSPGGAPTAPCLGCYAAHRLCRGVIASIRPNPCEAAYRGIRFPARLHGHLWQADP